MSTSSASKATTDRSTARARYADPGSVRSAWFPWLFTTGQGVAYSSARGDANVFVLIVCWGAFIYAGMVALWSTDNESAEAVPSEGAALREPKAGA
ncbi:hypothetical protein ACGFZB_27705 [Streptomyces cinerochromogenes]|uniref:Uncharacterized protein n=1 Tax=Streptomyces cinerochromogenes TaxID=66422 RepID=A0ABW7BBE1_9ACTN